MGQNTYIGLRRSKRANVIPIQGPVLKDEKMPFQKRFLQCISPYIGWENIYNLTIKAYFDPRIIDPVIFRLFPEGDN